LKEHSFRTEFVDLTYLEGQALSKSPAKRDSKDFEQLGYLEAKLEKVIAQFSAGAFVVRCSASVCAPSNRQPLFCRNLTPDRPKTSLFMVCNAHILLHSLVNFVLAVEDPELQRAVSEEFEKRGSNRTDTDEVWAFIMATNKSMCVKNGKEAIAVQKLCFIWATGSDFRPWPPLAAKQEH